MLHRRERRGRGYGKLNVVNDAIEIRIQILLVSESSF